MEYFEGFTCAKNPSQPESNEDQIVIRPNLVYAVIDGATDISGARWDDELGGQATGGRLASSAIARALYSWQGDSAHPPEPATILAELNAALASVYVRLGIYETAKGSFEARFRATFAGAFAWSGGVRLIRVGDSGFRINGAPVLANAFPADVVLALARSEAWHLLTSRGMPAAKVRPAVRQLIVKGLAHIRAGSVGGLSSEDFQAIERQVIAQSEALEAAALTPEEARHIMAGGLEAVRADPARFNAVVLDGISDVTASMAVLDVALNEVKTLEVFSDGYPTTPEGVSVAAWETALRYADVSDPERIGPFKSTKGRVGANFGDDRSIVIAKISAGWAA